MFRKRSYSIQSHYYRVWVENFFNSYSKLCWRICSTSGCLCHRKILCALDILAQVQNFVNHVIWQILCAQFWRRDDFQNYILTYECLMLPLFVELSHAVTSERVGKKLYFSHFQVVDGKKSDIYWFELRLEKLKIETKLYFAQAKAFTSIFLSLCCLSQHNNGRPHTANVSQRNLSPESNRRVKKATSKKNITKWNVPTMTV